MFFQHFGMEQERQVGGVHVTIDQHRAVRKPGETGGQTGFSGAAFTADDQDFFHRLPPIFANSRSNSPRSSGMTSSSRWPRA
ncbi:hypothetical protein SDC9_151808 [bioreactor metagenome]|uniref:Uncharacterized protein n=1 Tax=bioreactor metagenome TaxID=1076179 RepID=A0A645ERW4_9ZZZZ